MLFFIVGTRWRFNNSRRLVSSYKNLKIIRHDLFAEFIGLEGEQLRDFEHAIELNYLFDLEEAKEFLVLLRENFIKKYKRDLFYNEDFKKELKRMGLDYYSTLFY